MAASAQPINRHRPAGRRHMAARAGWLVVAVVVLNLFVLGLPLRYAYLLAQAAPVPAALLDWGVSARSYALILLGMESVVVGLWSMAAMVLFWQRSREPMVFFVALMLLLFGVMNGLVVRSPWALAALDPALEVLCRVLAFAAYTLFVLFFFVFPDGRFAPRWTVWLAVPCVLLVAGWVFAPRTDFVTTDWGTPLPLPVLIPVLGCLMALQIYRYVRFPDAVQQQQLRWVVFGVAASIVGFLEAAFATQMGGETFFVETIFASLCMLVIPVTFAVAVTRYRLFEIDLFINRALVYGILTVGVVAGYGLLVGFFSQVFQTSGNVLVSLIATGAIAVAFQPLRMWLQRTVNRLMFGDRAEPYYVLAQLGQRLDAAFAPSAVLPTIVQAVSESLKLPYVAIALHKNGDAVLAAATGNASGTPIHFPLAYGGTIVGHLLVSPRRGEAQLSPTDQRLLHDLAQQAGVAVHGIRLLTDLQQVTADLQRSREQIVVAREEERRRLRRNLHDDLAPTLAGLSFTAAAIGDLVVTDPAKATAVADHLHAGIGDAVRTIRRLVYDLRPPALDELGLSAAIRERAAQYSTVRAGTLNLEVTVEAAPALPPLPAAVEVAAYRIVQEALMNVAKHAHAQHCAIRLAVADALLIEIADDGVGIADTRRNGVGLRSMQEQAAELGGTCAIEPRSTGGTRIAVRLPLPNEAVYEPHPRPDR